MLCHFGEILIYYNLVSFDFQCVRIAELGQIQQSHQDKMLAGRFSANHGYIHVRVC